jgi:hypothetical protein
MYIGLRTEKGKRLYTRQVPVQALRPALTLMQPLFGCIAEPPSLVGGLRMPLGTVGRGMPLQGGCRCLPPPPRPARPKPCGLLALLHASGGHACLTQLRRLPERRPPGLATALAWPDPRFPAPALPCAALPCLRACSGG